MTFQSALTATEYTKLRGNASTPPRYAAVQYMVLCPNTTVFAARVNGAPTGGSFAQVTYDTVTTGAYTAIETGMTVLIASSNDRRAAHFAGFARKTPTSTILYLNETSAGISDDDYIWVIDDYRVFVKWARKSGSTIYKNYDQTFSQVGPVITNLKTAYAGIASSGVLSLSFVATAIAGSSGASISSYAWTIGSGMAVTAGSASTNTVTIEFDEGAFYWLKLVVTDSNGVTATRRIAVASIPDDLSGVVYLGFDGADIEGDVDTGWRASVAAFDGISTVLDNTFCIVFDVEHYNGTETTIDSNNVKFVGRLRVEDNQRQEDSASGFVKETRFELEGIGDQLSRTPTLPLTLVNDSTPTVWDDINNATHWRAILHLLQTHSTALTLHALAFDDTSNDSVFDTWGVDGGDLFTELQGMAEDWVSNLEFSPDGRIEVNRRGSQKSTADRASQTTLAAMTNQDFYGDLSIAHAHLRDIGVVEAGGGVYNSNSDTIQEYLSQAPGDARDPYAGVYAMPGQVLTANSSKAAAETELNTRSGHALAEQNPADELTLSLPGGWNFLIPSRAVWYTWTLSAADTNLRGIAYTTAERWWLKSISVTHDNRLGTKDVNATFRRETEGAAGITIDPPAESEIDYILPTIPPFPSYPGFPINPDLLTPPGQDFEPPPYWQDEPPVGEVEGVKVKSVFFGTGADATNTGAWTCQQFVHEASPQTVDVTPNTLPDGHLVVHGKLGFGLEAYLLTHDGAESILWYTSNVWTNNPTWVQNDTLTDAYSLIRLGATQGEVYLYAQLSDNQPEDWDTNYWLSKSYAFNFSRATAPGGEEFATDIDAYTGGVGILVDVTITESVFHSIGYAGATTYDSIFENYSRPGNGTFKHLFCTTLETGVIAAFPAYTRWANDKQTNIRTAAPPQIVSVFDGATIGSMVGSLRIIVEKATQAFPSGSGTPDIAQTVYSADYGATFGAAETVGDPIDGTYGGMDTIKIGDLVLAASDGQVMSAQSGGAFSAYGSAMPTNAEPAAILIPRATFGTTSGNNAGTTTPEYLVASDVLTAANEALWKVTSSGATFTDITPYDGSNYGLATGPDCVAMSWRSGNKIAVVLLFGSLPKLYTSDDAGASWTSHGVLTADANAVTFRKGDADLLELYGTDGQPWFTGDAFNGVATITKRSYPRDPNTDPVKWIDVYG